MGFPPEYFTRIHGLLRRTPALEKLQRAVGKAPPAAIAHIA
jgi:hypothetical protein